MDKDDFNSLLREAKMLRQKADAVRKSKPIEASRLDEQARKLEEKADTYKT